MIQKIKELIELMENKQQESEIIAGMADGGPVIKAVHKATEDFIDKLKGLIGERPKGKLKQYLSDMKNGHRNPDPINEWED